MKPTSSLAAAFLASAVPSQAALTAILNGDFETDVTYNLTAAAGLNADSTAGGGWFESSTSGFNDFIANTSAPGFDSELHDNGNALFLVSSTNYIYQSLGTVGSETAATFTFDALERRNGNNKYTVTIELFASTTFVGANGTDVKGAAGVAALGLGSYNYTSGDGTTTTNNDQDGVQIANLSLTGANVGDQIWVRISTPRPSGDATTQIDNLSVTYVPEPSSALLLGLAGMAVALRRRR